jgi:hypothetical protein
METIDTHVRFEVFTALTMKKAIFWDVAVIWITSLGRPLRLNSILTI